MTKHIKYSHCTLDKTNKHVTAPLEFRYLFSDDKRKRINDDNENRMLMQERYTH